MIKPSGRVVYKLLLTARHQSRPLLAACSTNHIQAFNARYSSGDVESRKHELSEKKLVGFLKSESGFFSACFFPGGIQNTTF